MKESVVWKVAVVVESTIIRPSEHEAEHHIVASSINNALSLIRYHYEDDQSHTLIEVTGLEKQEGVLVESGDGKDLKGKDLKGEG